MNLKQKVVTIIAIALTILFNFGVIKAVSNSSTKSEAVLLTVIITNILIYLVYRFELKIRE